MQKKNRDFFKKFVLTIHPDTFQILIGLSKDLKYNMRNLDTLAVFLISKTDTRIYNMKRNEFEQKTWQDSLFLLKMCENHLLNLSHDPKHALPDLSLDF